MCRCVCSTLGELEQRCPTTRSVDDTQYLQAVRFSDLASNASSPHCLRPILYDSCCFAFLMFGSVRRGGEWECVPNAA